MWFNPILIYSLTPSDYSEEEQTPSPVLGGDEVIEILSDDEEEEDQFHDDQISIGEDVDEVEVEEEGQDVYAEFDGSGQFDVHTLEDNEDTDADDDEDDDDEEDEDDDDDDDGDEEGDEEGDEDEEESEDEDDEPMATHRAGPEVSAASDYGVDELGSGVEAEAFEGDETDLASENYAPSSPRVSQPIYDIEPDLPMNETAEDRIEASEDVPTEILSPKTQGSSELMVDIAPQTSTILVDAELKADEVPDDVGRLDHDDLRLPPTQEQGQTLLVSAESAVVVLDDSGPYSSHQPPWATQVTAHEVHTRLSPPNSNLAHDVAESDNEVSQDVGSMTISALELRKSDSSLMPETIPNVPSFLPGEIQDEDEEQEQVEGEEYEEVEVIEAPTVGYPTPPDLEKSNDIVLQTSTFGDSIRLESSSAIDNDVDDTRSEVIPMLTEPVDELQGEAHETMDIGFSGDKNRRPSNPDEGIAWLALCTLD